MLKGNKMTGLPFNFCSVSGVVVFVCKSRDMLLLSVMTRLYWRFLLRFEARFQIARVNYW